LQSDRVPTLPGSQAASSGFLTLSTLYASHSLPSLFHPGSAFGVCPTRYTPKKRAVRPLERRNPHGVGSDLAACASPSGLITRYLGSPARTLAVNQEPATITSLGLEPLQGFAIRSGHCSPKLTVALPSRASTAYPTRGYAVGTPGCPLRNTALISQEINEPS